MEADIEDYTVVVKRKVDFEWIILHLYIYKFNLIFSRYVLTNSSKCKLVVMDFSWDKTTKWLFQWLKQNGMNEWTNK